MGGMLGVLGDLLHAHVEDESPAMVMVRRMKATKELGQYTTDYLIVLLYFASQQCT